MKPKKILLTALGSCVALAFSSSILATDANKHPESKSPVLNEERVPDGETDMIAQLVEIQSLIQRATNTARQEPLRGQHGKTHGCLDAELRVHGDLPESVRQGLFAKQGTYRVTLRFSNGKNLDDDRNPDVHGMAIKVHDVQGPKALKQGPDEQDFVLIDSPEFFAPDVASVLALMQAKVAAAQGSDKAIGALNQARPELLKRAKALLKFDLASPLASSYWSTVPYSFGDAAAKFLVHPVPSNTPSDNKPDDPDYLRHVMARQLANAPAQFDLLVQVQQDAAAQPIEDPTVPWQVPEIKIASLIIPSQQFDSQEQLDQCNELVFAPWHALTSQAPVGGINRARRAVYKASVAIRK